MNQPRPSSLWSRLRAAFSTPRLPAITEASTAYDVTSYPGSGGGYFGRPTPPTLMADGLFRSSTSGSRYSGGTIYGVEKNAALLTPRQWAEEAEQMQRTDGTVRLAVQGYLQTMGAPAWSWAAASVPASRRAEADFYALFFADMWSRMSVSWDQQIQYLARFGLTGFRYAEQIDVVRLGIEEPDGSRRLRTMVDVFADCEPTAHWQWVSLDGGRTLDGVTQIDQSSAFGIVSVDREGETVQRNTQPRTNADRLLLLVHGQTGTNWDGDGGMMRPAWGSWMDKADALNLRAAALAKFGVPVPHRKTNEAGMREAGYTSEQIKQANAVADGACSQWAGGDSTHLGSDSNVDIQFIGGVFDASNFNDTISACDQQIVMSMSQPFLIMGLGDSTGSRALSTQSASHFDVGVENDLDYIRDQINGTARAGGGVVGRLMRANWPDVPQDMWPHIEHGGLKADDFNDLSGVLSAWKSTGLLRSRALTSEILTRMEIPHTADDIAAIMADTGDPLENVSVQGAREQDNPPVGTPDEADDAVDTPAGSPGTGRPSLEGGAENPSDKKPRVVTV